MCIKLFQYTNYATKLALFSTEEGSIANVISSSMSLLFYLIMALNRTTLFELIYDPRGLQRR